MRRTRWRLLKVGAALAVGLVFTNVQAVAAVGAWTVTRSPNQGVGLNEFLGVAAVSPNNLWAVGDSRIPYGATNRSPLIENNAGSGWNVVPSPTQTTSSTLFGVAASGARDVWAVGQSFPAALIEHYDGTSWSVVSNPGSNASLNGVAAISPTDAWAVGGGPVSAGSVTDALTEHWDGKAWRPVSAAVNPSQRAQLTAVAAVSASDVWAVGLLNRGTLVEHWTGGPTWNVVPAPATGRSRLFGVAAVASNDVWAVGQQSGINTLVEHWNGVTWSVVPSPNPAPAPGFNFAVSAFSAVAARSTNDVWAVGLTFENGAFSHTLTEHWDGSTWTIIASQNPATIQNILNGVAVAAGGVTAVGQQQSDQAGNSQTLVLQNPG
jgi:hypothetical protein